MSNYLKKLAYVHDAMRKLAMEKEGAGFIANITNGRWWPFKNLGRQDPRGGGYSRPTASSPVRVPEPTNQPGGSGPITNAPTKPAAPAQKVSKPAPSRVPVNKPQTTTQKPVNRVTPNTKATKQRDSSYNTVQIPSTPVTVNPLMAPSTYENAQKAMRPLIGSQSTSGTAPANTAQTPSGPTPSQKKQMEILMNNLTQRSKPAPRSTGPRNTDELRSMTEQNPAPVTADLTKARQDDWKRIKAYQDALVQGMVVRDGITREEAINRLKNHEGGNRWYTRKGVMNGRYNSRRFRDIADGTRTSANIKWKPGAPDPVDEALDYNPYLNEVPSSGVNPWMGGSAQKPSSATDVKSYFGGTFQRDNSTPSTTPNSVASQQKMLPATPTNPSALVSDEIPAYPPPTPAPAGNPIDIISSFLPPTSPIPGKELFDPRNYRRPLTSEDSILENNPDNQYLLGYPSGYDFD